METLLMNPSFWIFGCPFLLAMVVVVAHYWHKARLDDLEASLKHEMLERGMSADDIVKVLKASKSAELTEEESLSA